MQRTATPEGGFVLTMSDITERVRAKQTAQNAQRMQAISQLTGGIAHDFNNLLTVILGNLESLAVDLGEEAAGLPQIERATWATKRGAALSQQLLAFACKRSHATMPINLSPVLTEMASLLRWTLGKHIAVRVMDSVGLWPALADPTQVEIALLNLALNARDAMPGGGCLILEVANKVLDREYARQHADVTSGDYVMLAVSDTGTGMSPEVLARVFEPFFTTKEEGKGTGLGLTMVHGFAKQAGGHVSVYSEPGVGTTVRLYLPRAIGAVISAPQTPSRPVEPPRGSATILVVEDEANVREVAVEILRDLDYRVLESSHGAEAMRVFGEAGAKVDLLLVDVALPGRMTGNEVAQKLTEIQPDLRVLLMSGHTENTIMHHNQLDEGVELIGKPFSRAALGLRVAEILGIPIPAPTATANSKVVKLSPRDL